jgi:tyrosyl-DNA phosphodiesterase 2
MQRDALFVDIPLPSSLILRLCTTHLESLCAVPPKRPAQLAAAASHLRQAHAGILAGDLNAIEEFDKTLPSECGLKDAYLESGGVEGDEGGMTWGQMAWRGERRRWGLSRMDKVLFCGGVRLVGFERFGMDVVVEEEEAARELVEGRGLEKAWVTDHLGVKAEFVVEVGEGDGREGVDGMKEGSTREEEQQVAMEPAQRSSI